MRIAKVIPRFAAASAAARPGARTQRAGVQLDFTRSNPEIDTKSLGRDRGFSAHTDFVRTGRIKLIRTYDVIHDIHKHVVAVSKGFEKRPS